MLIPLLYTTLATLCVFEDVIGLENTNLPNWNGTWRGSLVNYPIKIGAPSIDVLMEIGPFPSRDNTCSIWKNTYSENGTVIRVKDYKLCRDQGPDELVIDEGNNVRLKTRWIGNVLTTPFKYDNILLISSTRIHDDVLEEDILIMDDKPAIKGIQTMYPSTIQRLTMKRIE